MALWITAVNMFQKDGRSRLVLFSISFFALLGVGAFAAVYTGRVSFQSFGNFYQTSAPKNIDGQAIREKNRVLSEATTTRSASTISINAQSFFNASSTFRGRAYFLSGLTSNGPAEFQQEVVVRGLLRGTDIDLGSGTITASNIIYSVSAGDGITVTGGQRPTISDAFWRQQGNTISTKNPLLSLSVGGGINIGTVSGSILNFAGPATITNASTSVTVIPDNTENAWTIATSSTALAIFSVSSQNGGTVSIGSEGGVGAGTTTGITSGTSSKIARLTVRAFSSSTVGFRMVGAPDQGAILFEVHNASSSGLFLVDGSGRVGIGGTSTNLLTVNGSSTFAGQLTASSSVFLAAGNGSVGIGTLHPTHTLTVLGTERVTGDALFEASPLIPVVNCSGSRVLETDSDGRISCGSDDRGSGTVVPINPGNAGNITFYPADGTTLSGATNLFFDAATGNFGIGSSSPARTLSVQGPALFAGSVFFDSFTSSSTVATSTIAGGLIVSGGGLRISTLNCSLFSNSGALTTDSNGNIICSDDDGGGVATGWTDQGATVVLSTSSDFVGIGSTTPGVALAVTGRGIFTDDLTALSLTATSTTASSSLQGLLVNQSIQTTNNAIIGGSATIGANFS